MVYVKSLVRQGVYCSSCFLGNPLCLYCPLFYLFIFVLIKFISQCGRMKTPPHHLRRMQNKPPLPPEATPNHNPKDMQMKTTEPGK